MQSKGVLLIVEVVNVFMDVDMDKVMHRVVVLPPYHGRKLA